MGHVNTFNLKTHQVLKLQWQSKNIGNQFTQGYGKKEHPGSNRVKKIYTLFWNIWLKTLGLWMQIWLRTIWFRVFYLFSSWFSLIPYFLLSNQRNTSQGHDTMPIWYEYILFINKRGFSFFFFSVTCIANKGMLIIKKRLLNYLDW